MDVIPPNSPPPLPKSWWGRNWKWFVPTGCLTLFLIGVLFAGSVAFVVFSAMKSTDAYQIALARSKADKRVTEALGTPIQAGVFVLGNANVNGPSGNAELAIPISGPKGKGTIYLEAEKSEGQWRFPKLSVEIAKTRERIDLSDKDDGDDAE